jgi:catechol 2,3-dioxygenase
MSPINRRNLLRLAGVATASAALAGAVRAEGFSILPERPAMFATATPVFVQSVTLRVRDPELMARFYTEIIGLTVLSRDDTTTRLGVDDIALVIFEHRPDAPFSAPTEAGLYHTAFLMPSREDLARWLVHTGMAQYPFTGFADHRVSEAAYLDDPEGNGIEVYADRAPELWAWNGDTVVMGSEPIDFDSLLALTRTDIDTFASAPSGTRIGHVHLRAGDIVAARDFYAAALGLDITSGREDAVFLSSGGYHHHVALNTWQSAGAGQRDAYTTGLAELVLQANDVALLDAARDRLAGAGVQTSGAGNDLIAADPWGTSVRLAVA